MEIRVTRPEIYCDVKADLSGRNGHYIVGESTDDAIDVATKRFGSECIDVQLKNGEYLGLFKRVNIGSPDERYIKLPHKIG